MGRDEKKVSEKVIEEMSIKCSSMYQLIYKLKKQGYSFVLISEELPELIGMCDRILILKDGQIIGEFKRDENLLEQDLIKVMV